MKTVRFKNPTYIGDPINAVKIFNEKEVDELVLLDVEASPKKERPSFKELEQIAQEAFMPIGYGGGIRTVQDAETLFKIGFEKVIVNSAFAHDPSLIRTLSDKFGSQSVVVSIDVKKNMFGSIGTYGLRGTKKTDWMVQEHAQMAQEMGAGEIILQSIDRDGTMEGYDIAMLEQVCREVSIPVVALGGAGKIEDLKDAIVLGNASAAAAASMFVYQGKLKGILIQYPRREKLVEVFSS